MSHRRLHLELLLGRRVYDVAGKYAGRIEEIQAHPEAGGCVIDEYHLGRGGMLERLSVSSVLGSFIGLLGGYARGATHRVPWRQMDLSYPRNPRLRCRMEDLEELKES